MSGSLKFLAVLAALILVLGGLGIAGGFDRRERRAEAYPIGTELDAGPFTFTLTHIEITPITAEQNFKDKVPVWEINTYGTITNTTDKALLLQEPGVIGFANGEVMYGSKITLLIHQQDGTLMRHPSFMLEPGMTAVPMRLTQTLPERWQPPDQLYAGMRLQTFAAHDAPLGNWNKIWRESNRSVGFWVPVAIQPIKPR